MTAGFSGTADRANAVAIQSDGKIIAAGSSEGFVALIRFNRMVVSIRRLARSAMVSSGQM